jgi:polyhydroxyalkanoate synthase
VHQENKWRLLRYRTRPDGPTEPTPVLLVPSVINRHYVLDLLPGRSLAGWLADQGHDVFCIDWGTPDAEDRFIDFDTLVDAYLGRALQRTCRAADAERAHLFGYCLGGTFAAVHAARRPERVASLTTLAGPVRFADESLLSVWARTESFDVDALIAGTGLVPWPLMQGAFHLLRPTLSLSKAVHLLDRAWNDEFLDGFLALETWGNDNVSLPGAFYRTLIEDLYRKDRLWSGSLSVAGRPVSLRAITCPTQVITFEHDHIAPAASCAALLEQASSETLRHVHKQGGHVGGAVSSSAARRLWPDIDRFFRDVAPT